MIIFQFEFNVPYMLWKRLRVLLMWQYLKDWKGFSIQMHNKEYRLPEQQYKYPYMWDKLWIRCNIKRTENESSLSYNSERVIGC